MGGLGAIGMALGSLSGLVSEWVSTTVPASLFTWMPKLLAAGGGDHGPVEPNPGALFQAPVLILLPLLFGSVLVPGMGLIRRRLAFPTTLVVLIAFAFFAFRGLAQVLSDGAIHYKMAGWIPPIGIELVFDTLSAFVVAVIATIAVAVTIFASTAVRRENPEKEVAFFGVMVIMLLGLTGMVLTGDLFNLYVFFEVSSLSAYALMAIGHPKAPVSAFRYLLMGTLGASFYLIGVGYLYILTGSLNMVDVAGLIGGMGDNPALQVSVIFMVTGLGLKMAMFPMHLWLPDAYTYASSTSTAIIAPVMTKVSAYVLIRMLLFVYPSSFVADRMHLGPIITWLSMAGVIVGSVMAIAQRDAKRMLAYSSIAQVGYIGVGIGLGTPLALIGAVLHILNHAIMKSCLFLVTGTVSIQTGIQNLNEYTGLGRKMPWTFAGFTLAALAMVGIPPTSGFFSKWYLVLGAMEAGQWLLVGLILASGLLTAGYFFRVLEKVYARTPESGAVEDATDPPFAMRLPLLLLAALTLVLGLANAWIVREVVNQALPAALRVGGM